MDPSILEVLEEFLNLLKKSSGSWTEVALFFKPADIHTKLTDGLIMPVKRNMGHAEYHPDKQSDFAIVNILNREPNLLDSSPVCLTKVEQTAIQIFIKVISPSISFSQLPVRVHAETRLPGQSV